MSSLQVFDDMQPRAQDTLVIVEGPAGCGKSHAINQLRAKNLVQLPAFISTLDRPRNYDGLQGLLLSQLKDQATTIGWVSNARGGELNLPTIADRWGLSQMAYGALRRYETPSFGFCVKQLLAMLRGIRSTCSELETRASYIGQANGLRVVLNIILPTLDLLEANRLRAKSENREYPFEASRELEAYKHISSYIRDFNDFTFPGINVEVTWNIIEITDRDQLFPILETIVRSF